MSSWFSALFTSPPTRPADDPLTALIKAWPLAAAAVRGDKITGCNSAFAALVQLSPAEVVGMPWTFMLGVDPSANDDPFKGVIAGRPYEVSAVRVGEDRFVTVRDVSDNMDERTDEVANARQEVLNSIVFSLAHDLRNALTGLSLNLEALETASTDERQELVAECRAATALMTDMVADLHLKRISEEGTAFEPVRAVRAAIRLVKHQIPEGVAFEQVIEPTPVLRGSPARLTQAVMNLLVNAGDACRDLKRPGRIQVVLRSVENDILIEVHDSGAGVPPSLRAAIQATYYTTKGNEGSGVGLAITRRVTGEFGGVLEVGESPLGGALFTLRFATAPKS